MNSATSLFPIALIFVVALLLRALFAFMETSLTALRLFRLKELAKRYPHYERLFELLEDRPEQILVSVLIASSIADVVSAAAAPELTQRIFVQLGFSSNLGFFVGIIVATIMILIVGEIIPKSLARTIGSSTLATILPLTNVIYLILRPVSNRLISLSSWIGKRFGATKNGDSAWISSWKELRFLIAYTHQKGLLEPAKAEMLHSVFESARTPIAAIMTPIERIISLPDTTNTKQAQQAFIKHPFTRLPVYHNDPRHIIGLLHLKDLLRAPQSAEQEITSLLRPVMFVSETMRAKQLLHQFQERRIHLAIVADKQNNAIGLVTLEDTLEEIVGEISDEHE